MSKNSTKPIDPKMSFKMMFNINGDGHGVELPECTLSQVVEELECSLAYLVKIKQQTRRNRTTYVDYYPNRSKDFGFSQLSD